MDVYMHEYTAIWQISGQGLAFRGRKGPQQQIAKRKWAAFFQSESPPFLFYLYHFYLLFI